VVRGERRVLKKLHHDAVVAPTVPRVGRVRTRAHVIPHRLRRGSEAVGRHRILQDDEAVLVPEREIVGRETREMVRLMRNNCSTRCVGC
jgi:hypothetical protein